jgi:lipopolysaccharide/colanic/teichoic acid biosynthesis glycosyltransferase
MKAEKVEASVWTEAAAHVPIGCHVCNPTPAEHVFPTRKPLARPAEVACPSPAVILPRHQFLVQLEREKRRSDRSKAPLSIVLFRMESDTGEKRIDAEQLVDILRVRKRATDSLGYLGKDELGLLLPDTCREGVEGYLKLINEQVPQLKCVTTTGTYPDLIFDSLGKERHLRPHANPFLHDHYKDKREGRYALKRSIDFAGALFGLLLLLPVMIVTAIAIAMTSPGPIVFRQIRVGQRGVPFLFYKFRSMYVNSDDRIHREFVTKLIGGHHEEINQGDKDHPLYKLKSDPRITPIGKFLRETCIDELPQLFNVLKGDMSLVGPRPPLPYEVVNYKSWQLRRILEIKPGITGLWQVEGHSTTTFDEMVRLDLRYIRRCSLKLDLGIIRKTVSRVLKSVLARL